MSSKNPKRKDTGSSNKDKRKPKPRKLSKDHSTQSVSDSDQSGPSEQDESLEQEIISPVAEEMSNYDTDQHSGRNEIQGHREISPVSEISEEELRVPDEPEVASDIVRSDRGDVEILPLETSEDQPTTTAGSFVKSKIARYATPLDLRKVLLPGEKHLASKMVIYFDEGQIFLGFFVLLAAFILYLFLPVIGLLIILALSGLMLMTTGYASEELHITNIRILMRRMNWVDRLFRIPKDSQYILDEIVSFDVQRAPINRALFVTGLLPLLLLLSPVIRGSTTAIIVILILSGTLILLSQRLGKRTISFSMSGGHQIHLGQYKGIPTDVVDTFIDIVMEKNVFESDTY